MQSVFISYSHADASFVDRLARDLRLSEIPATYDRWVLQVGDSIVEKILANVADADSVVVVLSKASTESAWVSKEIGVALTGELARRGVRIFPVLIEKCTIPPTLIDKFYADFVEQGYAGGMRRLLEALAPQIYGPKIPSSRQEAMQEFRNLIERADAEAIRSWCEEYFSLLAPYFGRRWEVCEGISSLGLPSGRKVNHLIVNGQSYSYTFTCVEFHAPSWNASGQELLRQCVREMQSLLDEISSDILTFRSRAALRLHNGYGSSQILNDDVGRPWETTIEQKQAKVVGIILVGRRSQSNEQFETLRSELQEASRGRIEIATYDRLAQALSSG